MPNDERSRTRVERLLASPRIRLKKPARRDAEWRLPYPPPGDLSAMFELCDGVELDDDTRTFGRGELADVTEWLVLEKGLSWPDEMIVVGERRDVVVALDLDTAGARAGGGVLEVQADDLGMLERVAIDVVGYLSARAGIPDLVPAPPEVAARRAVEAGDAAWLERELNRPFYPGSERAVAWLALELGAMLGASGERDRALDAFARSVNARVASVGRAAGEAERAAAWMAAAHAARTRGAAALALECEARSRT